MKMKRNKILSIIVIIFVFAFLFAGCGILPTTTSTKGTISGKVMIPPDASKLSKDISGWVPAAGAEVTVVDADGVTHTVIADEDGYYSFENIAAKANTVITATVTIDGKKIILKTVIDKAVSATQDYDAGTMDPESTALALIVEELVDEGVDREDIDLDEIKESEKFEDLVEQVTTAIEEGKDVTEDPDVTDGVDEAANEIINPPAPAVPVTGVKIVQGDQTLVIGQTVKLTANVNPSNASNKKVSWESDDETIATVATDGTVTAESEGTATIAVTTADKGKTDSVEINVVKIRNITQGTDHDTIQGAVTAGTTTSGDTVLVGVGIYTETGQIVIDKNLSIIGVDKDTTVIKPAQDTGGPADGDNRGWFLVESGVEFNLNNVTLDGENQNIFAAVYSHGGGTIENSVFKNIVYPNYQGWVVAIRDEHAMTIKNNEFIGKARIGVRVWNSNGTQIISNTFTGSGDGDYLQYGIEVNGATQNTLIEGNDFSYYGTSTTAWGSGAIFVNDAYKDGMTSVTITNNTIIHNEVGIYHGSNRGWPEILNVETTGNQLTDNGRHVVDVSNDTTSAYVLDLDAVLSGNTFPDGKAQVVGKTIRDIEDAKVYNLDTGYIGVTIQEVINDTDTSTGDTILVGAGTYTENLTVDKANLTLKTDGNVILDDTTIGGESDIAVNIMADNVTIDGLQVKNAYAGFVAYGKSGITIKNSSVSDSVNGIIVYKGSTGSQIIDNNISSLQGRGIVVGFPGDALTTTDNTVNGNTISDVSLDGIYADYYSNTNEYINNIITNAGENGIHLYKSNTDTVKGNTITGSGANGLAWMGSYSNHILENTITDNTGYGIEIRQSTGTGDPSDNGGNLIIENTIQDNNDGTQIYEDGTEGFAPEKDRNFTFKNDFGTGVEYETAVVSELGEKNKIIEADTRPTI